GPLGPHRTNILLHALTTAGLFLVLAHTTRATWPSAAVAALFTCHPLHVESVAWISERKDVLCAFFFVLTLAAYAWYSAKPDPTPYRLLAAALTLGLLAKPMLTTVPFLLLLLDIWPLARLPFPITTETYSRLPRLILEKIPLLLLAIGSSYMTWL